MAELVSRTRSRVNACPQGRGTECNVPPETADLRDFFQSVEDGYVNVVLDGRERDRRIGRQGVLEDHDEQFMWQLVGWCMRVQVYIGISKEALDCVDGGQQLPAPRGHKL